MAPILQQEASCIPRRLEGKVAIITGGASGIGESITRLFVYHGAKVVVADIQDELGHSLCKEIGSEDVICYVHCDVANEKDIQNVVDTAVSKYGKLDIMMNNAGTPGNMDNSIVDITNENFKQVMDINVFGSFLGSKHAAKVMIPQKKGTIIFTASIAGIMAAGNVPHAYCVSKHAMLGLMKTLCVELGNYGIRVNSISPGPIVSSKFAEAFGLDMSRVEGALEGAGNLKGVLLKNQDAAEAAVFLASDESKYVNGHNLVIDGGYSTNNPAVSMAFHDLLHAAAAENSAPRHNSTV